jgi:arylsulfatase B
MDLRVASPRCLSVPRGATGVRADAFVNGGLLPAAVRGTKLAGAKSYVHLCDWYATFCGLAGVDPHDALAEKNRLPPVDSLDLWPMLSGRNLTSPRIEILFSPLKGLRPPHEIPEPDTHMVSNIPKNPNIPADLRDPMIIIGEWKLLLGQVDQCWWQGPRYPNGSSTWNTHATYMNEPVQHVCTSTAQIQPRGRRPASSTCVTTGL